MKLARLVSALFVLGLFCQTGCKHHGPRTITADRLPYNEAIATSSKEQTLLNIVKMRYMDTPFFVEVPQITSGYTYGSSTGVGAGIYPPLNPLANFSQQLGLNLNFQGVYQDRPTISYQPQTGSQFIRSLTSPINPGSVLFLIQSGYPADIVLDLTVETINGIKNQTISGGQFRPADPEFAFIGRTLRKAQMEGHIGIRVEKTKDMKDSVTFVFHDQNVSPELAKELAEVRRILRIDPIKGEFHVVFGAAAANENEIAILSRSVYRILQELSVGVSVPADHLCRGIAPPIGVEGDGANSLFRVYSGPDKPCDAFVAVCYEGHWFWIEKSDSLSKRNIGNLLVLLAFSDTGAKENLPVITIQAN